MRQKLTWAQLGFSDKDLTLLSNRDIDRLALASKCHKGLRLRIVRSIRHGLEAKRTKQYFHSSQQQT